MRGGILFFGRPVFIKIIFPPLMLKVFCIPKLFVIAYRISRDRTARWRALAWEGPETPPGRAGQLPAMDP